MTGTIVAHGPTLRLPIDTPLSTRLPEPSGIVHVTTSFPPATHGGIETYVRRIAVEQLARGDRVEVRCTAEGSVPGKTTEAGVPVRRVPAHPPISQVLDGLPTDDALFADPPTVRTIWHVHHWHLLGNDLVRQARRHGAAVVVTLHDLYVTCPLFFRVRGTTLCAPEQAWSACDECIASLVPPEVVPRVAGGLNAWRGDLREELRAADLLLALSRSQAGFLAHTPGLHDLQLRVVDLPPPDERSIPRLPSRPEVPGGEPLRIVTWGGLVRGKGLDLLRIAAGRMTGPIEIHHFGRCLDAELADSLRTTDPGSRVRVVLHGAFAFDDLADHGPFDLAVFPSRYLETYGYAVDEALLTGLPVLTSDRGAPPERLGTRGLTFLADDVDDLARQLEALHDPALRARLRGGAPRFHCGIDEHLAALDAVYAEALTSAAAR